MGTTHSRVYTAPAASRIPGKAFNSGGEAFPVAAALRTARRKTKTRRARRGAARRGAGPESGSILGGSHRVPTSDPSRPDAAVARNLQLNARGHENKCAPPPQTSAARPHPA